MVFPVVLGNGKRLFGEGINKKSAETGGNKDIRFRSRCSDLSSGKIRLIRKSTSMWLGHISRSLSGSPLLKDMVVVQL